MDDLLYWLKDCQGVTSAVSSNELSSLLNTNGASIRKMVNTLRRKGFPICSDEHGYYMAKTATELYMSVGNLKSRVEGITGAMDGMRKTLGKAITGVPMSQLVEDIINPKAEEFVQFTLFNK